MASDTGTHPDAADGGITRDDPFSVWREIGGILLFASGLCVLLALASFEGGDASTAASANLIGPVGATVADALLYVFGVGAFLFDAILLVVGFNLLVGRHVEWRWGQAVGHLTLGLAVTALAHLFLGSITLLEHRPGGAVGAYSGEVAQSFFGYVGASILGTSLLLLGVTLATRLSPGLLLRRGLESTGRVGDWLRQRWRRHREYRERLREERQKIRDIDDDLIEKAARREAELEATDLLESELDLEDEMERRIADDLLDALRERIEESETSDRDGSPDDESDDSDADEDHSSDDEPADAESASEDEWAMGDEAEPDDGASEPEIVVHHPEDDEVDEASDAEPQTIDVGDSDIVDMQDERQPSGEVETDFGPDIVESEAQKEAREKQEELENENGLVFEPRSEGDFDLPPLDILEYDTEEVGVDADALREMATEIEETLADFKIDGSVVEICPGPVITMFEFEPAPGTKISKISNRADDLAMNLAAQSVRVVAPIPGKSVVGIEVSNPEREMVWLKEILADESFQDDDMSLPLALGKGTAGEVETTDLADMPHLLVAGATGSGKSVAVNSMICSLLYNFTPDELQLIMIDPKVLEFSVYNGIPHLHLPVVTDPQQATVALNWAVEEMEKRYEKLAEMGVRDIRSYNDKVEELTEQARKDKEAGREESEALSKLGVDADGEPEHEPLPYLVVVIDEFADLMMTASKEVESAVARLAQKARAAGIHMILATQRPSTDVITGMIKANFPARIALRVTSNTDSRVILGDNGAENLLGNGDMLLMPPGSSDLKRVHGCFVSDDEIERVVDHVSDQVEPEYDESIIEEEEDDEPESPLDREMEKDEYYDDAVKLVVEKEKCSISMIQRKLRVGYNRAARMVEMMEEQGLVGASDGNTARDVLIDEVPEEL